MTTLEQPGLQLIRAVGAELAKLGPSRDRLAGALELIVADTTRQALLEIAEADGTFTSLRAGGEGQPGEAVALVLESKQRSLGTLRVHGSGFGACDHLAFEIVAQQIAAHLRCEYFAHTERDELETLLLGMVGHDLRNPLGIIEFAAESLLQGELTEAQRKTARRILGAGRQSARLVSDILDFTLARRDGIALRRDHHNVHAIVDQAIDDIRALSPARTIMHERDGEGTIYVDEGRMQQVVINVVGNAVQHSPPASTVRVETRVESDAVVVTVANEGDPIPSEVMSQIFLPLRRGDSAGLRPGSLGLGLFIARHLVVAHGGTIDVASSESEGPCFTIRLPVPSPRSHSELQN